MFSRPSGAKVSWSRAPPPKVMTTTFLRSAGTPARARSREGSKLPSVRPAASRRNSRRFRANLAAALDELPVISPRRRRVCYDSRRSSWLRGLRLLFGINKLPNLGATLIKLGQVAGAEALIGRELLPGKVLFAGVDISLTEAIMSVGHSGTEMKRAFVFRYGFSILLLIEGEIAQLKMRVGEIGIEGYGPLQQGLNISKVQTAILSSLPFPQTHRVIEDRARIFGLQIGETAESFNHFISLSRRTVVGLGEKVVAARVGRIEIRRFQKGVHRVIVVAAGVERHAETDV